MQLQEVTSNTLSLEENAKGKKAFARIIVEEQHEQEASGEMGIFVLCEVLEHQGPVTPGDACCKGSKHNVEVLWEGGSMVREPSSAVAAVDPVTLAACAEEHGVSWVMMKLQLSGACMENAKQFDFQSVIAKCCAELDFALCMKCHTELVVLMLVTI